MGFLSSLGAEGPKRRGSLGAITTSTRLDPWILAKLDEPVESASRTTHCISCENVRSYAPMGVTRAKGS